DTEPDMRGDRPTYRKVVDNVGHNRVGIAITAKRSIDVWARKNAEARQSVMPIAVLFLEPDRTPLNTAADTGVKAAVVSRAALEVGKEWTRVIDDTRIIHSERRRGNLVLLVRQAGPPALRPDVVRDRIGPPEPRKLRIRLSATKRQGKRCASA